MIDPDSAKFRDVRKCLGDRNVTAGKVNGKNRMGAYVGFTPFFVDNGKVIFVEDEGFLDAMTRCYQSSEDGKGSGPDEGAWST